MSLNVIIDRRRDATLASNRPLPSGRISVTAAHLICGLSLLVSIGAAMVYANLTNRGWEPLTMLLGTALLITFYDTAGKYLVALGLLTLGLIRFFHAIIPAPEVPLLWHPLVLFNHTTILSLVAYRWEMKRPPLTRLHMWAVLGGLALIDLVLIFLEVGDVLWKSGPGHSSILRALQIRPALAAPLLASVAFIGVAYILRRRRESRIAGQMIMLYGLLWLIVYDVAFAAGYVDPISAAVLLMLLPVAYAAVQIMRWWGRLVSLSQRPEFRRAEN
jgi:4-hydroxybenzoate polyprenyltransferase